MSVSDLSSPIVLLNTVTTVSIYGIGRIGGALAIALDRAGFKIEYLISRERKRTESVLEHLSGNPAVAQTFPATIDSKIVFITTPDQFIGKAADAIASSLRSRPTIFHTGGSLSSEVLSPLASLGFSTGSIHPLVSVSDPVSGANNFASAYFCIEGDEAALSVARDVVKSFGGISFTIPADKKPLYHAAAVMSAGHVVALFDMAVSMLAKCGIGAENARRLLHPLLATTVNNLQTQPPANALTGPFARGDLAAFGRNFASLDENAAKDETEIYLLLAERSVVLALQNGLEKSAAEELLKSISIAKRSMR